MKINLFNGRSGAAVASAILQGITLVSLFSFKKLYSNENFSALIVVIAWASVIGSAATFRLELLLLQTRKVVDKESILVTFAVASIFVIAVCSFIEVINWALNVKSPAVFNLIVLSLGYGLIEAQAFLSVQLGRLRDLILTRIGQVIGISISMLLSFAGFDFETSFGIFCLSILVPSLIWIGSAVRQAPGKVALFLPDRQLFIRGLSISTATSVNTFYTAAALIIAGHTQSVSFVADFGFVQKLLSGPITVIRHFYSHDYLSRVLKLMNEVPISGNRIWRTTAKVYWSSLATYSPFALVIIWVCTSDPKFVGISNINLVFYVALVTCFQVGVNSIAGVRSALYSERSFLLFDIFRLAVLCLSLLAPLSVAFELRFAFVSTLLYLGYFFFIRTTVLKLSA